MDSTETCGIQHGLTSASAHTLTHKHTHTHTHTHRRGASIHTHTHTHTHIYTRMALKTVELMPSATSNSPFSLGRVKLCSRPEPNILNKQTNKQTKQNILL